jgi:Gp37 protein
VGAIVLDSPWQGETYTPPTQVDIATIEQAVVNRLNTELSGVEIAHFPDKPEAYRMTHRVGAALVRYEGTEFGKPIDTAAMVQERTLKFEITVMMRDLGWSVGGSPAGGGTPGAYGILESIRAALTGFQVPACGKTYPLRERFLKRDKQGGVWMYAVTFAMQTVAVESSSPDNYPLLTLARTQEQGGITSSAAPATVYIFDSSDSFHLLHTNVSALQITDAASGAIYVAGIDYSADPINGIVTRASNGSIAAGASVTVEYSYADVVTALANGGSAPTAPTN